MSTIHLRAEQSSDVISIIELTAPAGFDGPPLHHHDFDEAFYVLEGELTFQVGDELHKAGPGSLTFAPRGSIHTFANLGREPARYLLICTPAGFERRFDPNSDGPSPDVTFVGRRIPERLASP
jgi:quercetin dioxygenase-like cupin family protein